MKNKRGLFFGDSDCYSMEGLKTRSLQGSVRAYRTQLEQGGPKLLLEVFDGLRSSYPNVKQIGDTLFSLD